MLLDVAAQPVRMLTLTSELYNGLCLDFESITRSDLKSARTFITSINSEYAVARGISLRWGMEVRDTLLAPNEKNAT